jgi:hypothetical protein
MEHEKVSVAGISHFIIIHIILGRVLVSRSYKSWPQYGINTFLSLFNDALSIDTELMNVE